MSAQISILDLLRTSPLYKEILDSDLHESHIPTNVNATKFQNLVGHLSASYTLPFKTSDIPTIKADHILLLQIAMTVSKFVVKWVMIDNGSALNICTLKFIK